VSKGESGYDQPDPLLGGPLLSPITIVMSRFSLSFPHASWLASPVQIVSGAQQMEFDLGEGGAS